MTTTKKTKNNNANKAAALVSGRTFTLKNAPRQKVYAVPIKPTKKSRSAGGILVKGVPLNSKRPKPNRRRSKYVNAGTRRRGTKNSNSVSPQAVVHDLLDNAVPEPATLPARFAEFDSLVWPFWETLEGSEFRLRLVPDADGANNAYWMTRLAHYCRFRDGEAVEIPVLDEGLDRNRWDERRRAERRLWRLRPRPLYVFQGFVRPNPEIRLFAFRNIGPMLMAPGLVAQRRHHSSHNHYDDEDARDALRRPPEHEFVLRMGPAGIPDYAACRWDMTTEAPLTPAERGEMPTARRLKDFAMPDYWRHFSRNDRKKISRIYKRSANNGKWEKYRHGGIPGIWPTDIPGTGM